MTTLNIGQDFSLDPSGRYRSDGDGSGESFREDCLLPVVSALSPDEQITIVLDDGVEGYGSSFLSEGFAGMVKYGHMTSEALIKVLAFSYADPDYKFYENRIVEYVQRAQFGSDVYDATD